jgi:hypothetical protein
VSKQPPQQDKEAQLVDDVPAILGQSERSPSPTLANFNGQDFLVGGRGWETPWHRRVQR